VNSPLAFLFGHFVHWVLYDWPISQHRIPENLARSKQLGNGALQGANGFGQIGYGGPAHPATRRIITSSRFTLLMRSWLCRRAYLRKIF